MGYRDAAGKMGAEARRMAGNISFLLVFACSLCVALFIASGSASYAFLFKESNELVSTFGTVRARMGVSVVEETEGSVVTSIAVENNGSNNAYVRVRLVSWMEDSDGAVLASGVPELGVSSTATWTEDAETPGVYYCTGWIAPGEKTENLLSSPLVLSNDETGVQVLDVLAEGVLATSQTYAEEAWGTNVPSAVFGDTENN